MANTIRIPVPEVAYARVELPEIDIKDNPYEELENAAAGIAGALDERKAQDDNAFLDEAEADGYNTASNHHLASQRSGGGVGQTLSLNSALDERQEYWGSRTNDPKLRKRLLQRYAKLRYTVLSSATYAEADARAEGAVRIAGATMDELAGIAFAYPEQIGAVRDEVDNPREPWPGTPEDLAAQKQTINEAYLRGLITQNPTLALETLRSRKGHAEEDLGIPETTREALERDAELAVEAESDSDSAAREHEQIALRLGAGASLATYALDDAAPLTAYTHLRDAYKVDTLMGRRMEADIDKAHANTIRRAGRNNSIGRKLVDGVAVTWTPERLASLDTHIEAVAGDGSDAATANARRVRMAITAGETPPKMQGHILKNLRATDPATRAGAVRMLQRLDGADETGKLTAWVPPDRRAFGHRFTALAAAGYTDAEALKQLDAANIENPATGDARRHHFDTYLRTDDLIDNIASTFNIKPTGIADDDMQTLEYRRDQETLGPQTLEYDSERDRVEWQPVLQKEKGKIKFMRPFADELCRTGSGCHPGRTGSVVTRNGTWVRVWQNGTGNRRLDYNCHGYTLAEGQFWIEEDSAEFILRDEFSTIPSDDIRPGDLVVYRDRAGSAVHSARIASVTRDRDGRIKTVRVIGKLGDESFGPVETGIDDQWPPPKDRNLPKYKGQTYERMFYRRST